MTRSVVEGDRHKVVGEGAFGFILQSRVGTVIQLTRANLGGIGTRPAQAGKVVAGGTCPSFAAMVSFAERPSRICCAGFWIGDPPCLPGHVVSYSV